MLYPGLVLSPRLTTLSCFYWQSNILLTILRVLRNHGKYLSLIACWRCIDDLVEVYVMFVRDGEAAPVLGCEAVPWLWRQGDVWPLSAIVRAVLVRC